MLLGVNLRHCQSKTHLEVHHFLREEKFLVHLLLALIFFEFVLGRESVGKQSIFRDTLLATIGRATMC